MKVQQQSNYASTPLPSQVKPEIVPCSPTKIKQVKLLRLGGQAIQFYPVQWTTKHSQPMPKVDEISIFSELAKVFINSCITTYKCSKEEARHVMLLYVHWSASQVELQRIEQAMLEKINTIAPGAPALKPTQRDDTMSFRRLLIIAILAYFDLSLFAGDVVQNHDNPSDSFKKLTSCIFNDIERVYLSNPGSGHVLCDILKLFAKTLRISRITDKEFITLLISNQ